MKKGIGKMPVSKAIKWLKLAQIHSEQPINTPRGIRINRYIVEQSLIKN